MSKIFILHENEDWLAPLAKELDRRGLPYEPWFMHQANFDLDSTPPVGVFYSRMSASSHTRGHRYAPEYTYAVMAWLARFNRCVINPGRALQLEISKAAQHAALNEHGIRTPRTYATVGCEQVIEAAKNFGDDAFIVKHNRAGKGLGVRLFVSQQALADYVRGDQFEQSVDGISLVQEYVRSAEPFITRCEFVGQRFLYALRVDNTQGFLLCPADECEVGDSLYPATEDASDRFRIDVEFDHPILESYRSFFESNDIHIAGIEFIVDDKGDLYTYDININTNYNNRAEKRVGLSGMQAIGDYLEQQLELV